MTALLLTVLGASVMGSLHCAGMCGPFVAVAAGGSARRTAARTHAAYSLGRLVTYLVLGAAAGTVGGLVEVGGGLAGVRGAAPVLAGSVIVVWGAASLAQAMGVPLPPLRAPRAIVRLAGRAVAGSASWPAPARGFALGLTTACLPCGWLYAFVTTAGGTGEALAGAAVMAAFWLGTIPALMGLALGLQALAAPLRRHLPVACAVAMVLIGLAAIAGRLGPAAGPAPHGRAGAEAGHHGAR